MNSHHDIYIQNLEHLLIEPRNKAWSVFAEAYDADARDFGASTPHFSFAAYIHWNLHFDDPTRVTASLLPEPACNAMQEFVCASDLIDLGFPVSSPSVVEPAGDLVSVPASSSSTDALLAPSNFVFEPSGHQSQPKPLPIPGGKFGRGTTSTLTKHAQAWPKQ